MIWLASFPRSGSTFFRNVLYEVYGIESSEFHKETNYSVDPSYRNFPFVKTHLLPSQLVPNDPNIPAVYLVRDGRDAMISIAHHRKDIVAPGSDFLENLIQAMIAAGGSHFGGWSENVSQWSERADIIIRFEDLVKDPIACVERLRKIYDLPEPDISKLPTFRDLKNGVPRYGSGGIRDTAAHPVQGYTHKFFRKGKSNNWKEEISEEMHDLIWNYHGHVLEKLGYSYNGEDQILHPDYDRNIIQKVNISLPVKEKKYRVLIEASKLLWYYNDGVKRYMSELLKAFYPMVKGQDCRWTIDLYINGKIYPLKDNYHLLFNRNLPEEYLKEKIAFSTSFNEYLKKNIRKNKWLVHLYYFLIRIYRRSSYFYKTKSESVRRKITKLFFPHKTKKLLDSYDLIHLPLIQCYKPFRGVKTKLIATVHDFTHIYFPQFHEKINLKFSYKGQKFIENKASGVIAISESTKKDFLKESNFPENKIALIYEAADKSKFRVNMKKTYAEVVKIKYNIPIHAPYLLCLSTIEPRKNLINTLKAFKKLIIENPDIDLYLVVAGKKGWKTKELFNNTGLKSDRILFTGFVEDEHLPVLYNEAMALSYISYYEGFGLPLLEAMNCKTPVIYGNNSSQIEVVGEAGLAADPDDIDDIAEKFKRLYEDKELRAKLASKGFKRAFKFTWRKTAIQTLEAYEKFIES
jgi:glycosyltransferase involved in cell wall biosynthesis